MSLGNSIIMPLHFSGRNAAGINIQVDEDVTVDGFLVPKLTPEQVVKAYNAIAHGKACSITNKDGNVHYQVLQSDIITGEPTILISHYWLGWVDYQISHDSVTITAHKI